MLRCSFVPPDCNFRTNCSIEAYGTSKPKSFGSQCSSPTGVRSSSAGVAAARAQIRTSDYDVFQILVTQNPHGATSLRKTGRKQLGPNGMDTELMASRRHPLSLGGSHRAAEARAELIPDKQRNRGRINAIVGVEIGITDKLVETSVERVRSRFRDALNVSTGVEAILRVIGIEHDAIFFRGLHAQLGTGWDHLAEY